MENNNNQQTQPQQVVYIQQTQQKETDKPMGIGAWFLTFFLLAIPICNFICTIVWACGVGNKSRVSFARTILICDLILIVLVAIFWSSFYTFIVGFVPAMA